MRKLAIGQLGTNDPSFDEKKFVEVLVDRTIRKIVPYALRLAVKTAKGKRKQTLEEAALRCERDGDGAAAGNAREVAADAADDASAAADAYSASEATYAAFSALTIAAKTAYTYAYAYAADDAASACAKSAAMPSSAIRRKAS
jgi:hypothetical protein